MDGFGAAWSRVPYILFTKSVLLLRADCHQYFYPLLQENVTHITINRGLKNLEATYIELEQNQEKAKMIAQNGFDFAEKYLTKNAIDTYLIQVIYDLNRAFNEQAAAVKTVRVKAPEAQAIEEQVLKKDVGANKVE